MNRQRQHRIVRSLLTGIVELPAALHGLTQHPQFAHPGLELRHMLDPGVAVADGAQVLRPAALVLHVELPQLRRDHLRGDASMLLRDPAHGPEDDAVLGGVEVRGLQSPKELRTRTTVVEYAGENGLFDIDVRWNHGLVVVRCCSLRSICHRLPPVQGWSWWRAAASRATR